MSEAAFCSLLEKRIVQMSLSSLTAQLVITEQYFYSISRYTLS
jgi:hypothetical protein